MFRMYCILIGYAIGCLQTSYFIGKMVKKIDIREHGSGNAGTTNTIRVLGTKVGALVFLLDVLKGIFGYVLCSLIFSGSGNLLQGENNILPGLYAGLGVIAGHDFPFFLKFKGGKGIASTLGVIACVDWRVACITFAFGLVSVIISKYVSLASLIMTALFPWMLYLYGYPSESVAIAASFGIIAYIQHRGNIVRLIKGNENKLSLLTKGKMNEGKE